MTNFPVPDDALVPDPDAQWWQRPTADQQWQPVAPSVIRALPAGTQLCRGGEQRVRSVDEARGCWCRPPGAAGRGRWVDAAAAKDAWARGEELWWPGAAAWRRALAADVAPTVEVMPADTPVAESPVPPAAWPKGPLPRSSYTINGHTFEMVRVPPGTFLMGSPPDEPERHDDEAQVQVTLSRAFEVGTFPVTQALWQAVIGGNPSFFAYGRDAPRRPVERVSWFDTVRFCNTASALCGMAAAYSIGAGERPTVSCNHAAAGFRLPTEAEWEYAARAGEAHRYAGSDDHDAVAWHQGNGGGSTRPVGGKRPNAWGLYDMSGNVWEWCWDGYKKIYAAGLDPVNPPVHSKRVSRGSSWKDRGLLDTRVASRYKTDCAAPFPYVGVRVVRTVA